MIEIILAKKAPPENETILGITSIKELSVPLCVVQPQIQAAINKCIVATRLVDN